MLTYKHRLPWINDKIRKLMNEQKKKPSCSEKEKTDM